MEKFIRTGDDPQVSGLQSEARCSGSAKNSRAARAGCSWREQFKHWVKVASGWPNESWAGIAQPCAKDA